jgi:hypothetical protein
MTTIVSNRRSIFGTNCVQCNDELIDLAEQRASNELVNLIRKLRWMGLEEEAEKVEKQLTFCHVPAGDSVVAAPCETD